MAGTPFDFIQEARRLIQFNTVTSLSNADCAVWLGSLFRRSGLEVSYQESRVDGILFLNLVGTIGRGKNPILLTTHLDTVDPGEHRLWTKTGGNPWKMTRRGETFYGLGVADTKLDILCKLSALNQVPLAKIKKPVILLGTFGEESGLRGAARFCQGDCPRPSMALVGEPSELSLVTRHKGLAVLEILLRGKGLHRPSKTEWVYEIQFIGQATHSSTPALGRNALQESIVFLKELKKRYEKVKVLSWEGGTGHNVIPASARVRFSLGDRPKAALSSSSTRKVKIERAAPGWYPTLPSDHLIWCIDSFGELVSPLLQQKDPAFQPPHLTWNVTLLRETKEGLSLTIDVRPLPGQALHRLFKSVEQKVWKKLGPPGVVWQFRLERDNSPLDLKKDSPLVKLAASALRSAKLPVKIAAKAGCSEAGLYARVGIPSIVVGPGRSRGNIHRPNESVTDRQLKSAIRFYKAFLEKTCF